MGSRRFKRLSKFEDLRSSGEDVMNLFYPRSCVACGRNLLPKTKVFCHICQVELPRCKITDSTGNRAEKLFYGRVRIEAATSYLYFKKHGMVQQMMHLLKYKGRQDIGSWVGDGLAMEMASSCRFNSIDLVIPVPLHSKKKRERGYNQVARFGQVLAAQLDIPFEENVLKRHRQGKSLTGKNRTERNESMQNAFSLEGRKPVEGKHVLLVDDIITSGATLEACAEMVLNLQDTRVSLASMALTW